MTDAAIAEGRPRPSRAAGFRIRQTSSVDELVQHGVLLVLGLFLATGLLLPLWSLLSKAFLDRSGGFVGLTNFAVYADTPTLSSSIVNSVAVALASTGICIPLAFLFAYGLTRTRMPGRRVFRIIAQMPILAPSLLPAISLVYLFGNQGLLRDILMGESIYGPIGIVAGSVFWTFPHALMILVTGLSTSDARLYEAAEALGAPAWRRFLTVTLPGVRYSLVSACFVVFTLVITDFGVPKVIGGQFNVLATDVYKQVVGQQNFSMGAVVGLVLLVPALLTFAVDRLVQRRQAAQLSSRAVPLAVSPNRPVDRAFLAICGVICLLILGIVAMAIFASVVRFWPYDLSFSFRHYRFDLMDGGGWESYRNSLVLATGTAIGGGAVVFVGAWAIEKTRRLPGWRGALHFLAVLPVAVPGLVLGLGYIFFFNAPGNPLGFLYGTMGILVLCTIVHFYAVPHLTAVTALKQLDKEYEAASASLKVPVWTTFFVVTVPICLPAILEIAMYFFVNAMTTVSAVVFLYSADTALASIAVLNMDDAGDVAPAAAMAVMIFLTAAAGRLLFAAATMGVLRSSQRWRQR